MRGEKQVLVIVKHKFLEVFPLSSVKYKLHNVFLTESFDLYFENKLCKQNFKENQELYSNKRQASETEGKRGTDRLTQRVEISTPWNSIDTLAEGERRAQATANMTLNEIGLHVAASQQQHTAAAESRGESQLLARRMILLRARVYYLYYYILLCSIIQLLT
jgi:hypothetical protein